MATGWVIAQVSDPHLTTPVPGRLGALGLKRLLSYLSWLRKRRHRHRTEILAAVLDDLRASRPDHLLVSGDLTHLGLPGECREALTWLEGLGDPRTVSVIPGNHDVLTVDDWATTAGLWRAFYASDPDAVPGVPAAGVGVSDREGPFPCLRRCGSVILIGLNTAVPTPPLFASGRLGAAQRDRLGGILEASGRAGLFRLVFLHHSPLPDGHTWRKRLRDAGPVLDLLQRVGAELVVHGHGHHEALDVVATAAGPMVVVGAPSASLAGAYAAGWNRYSIVRTDTGWAVGVECRRWGPEGVVVRASSDHALSRNPGFGATD